MIAGQNRGKKLQSVPGLKTRPTADRVKEAVFSSLEGVLYGSRFLDVFGGTGGIGLEAASRGAAEVILLEKDSDALRVIQSNITACGQTQRCQLLRGDSLASLAALGRQGKQFDLVYVDPPYQSGLYEMVIQQIADKGLLARNGLILLECAKSTSICVENGIFFIWREKYYGDTRIVYLKYKVNEGEKL